MVNFVSHINNLFIHSTILPSIFNP